MTIYGQSGCTREILNHFYHYGRGDIQSFSEVEIFNREYSQDPSTIMGRENLRLRVKITKLRETSSRLEAELAGKLANRETALITEREGIPTKMQVLSEQARNPLVKLWHWLQCLRLRWRLYTLTNHFSRELAKPYKKEEAEIARVREEHEYLKSHFDAILAKCFAAGQRAKNYLDANRQLFIGAAGEEAVIRVLKTLPDPFVVFNDVRFSLSRSVYWKRGGEYVRSSQVDHVVVGPGGIYLLETKNWGPGRVASEGGFTPEHQIARAEFIFYIVASDHFRFKLPTRCLVVMVQGSPILHYEFVTKLPLNVLVPHLLHAPRSLKDAEIYRISEWLHKN